MQSRLNILKKHYFATSAKLKRYERCMTLCCITYQAITVKKTTSMSVTNLTAVVLCVFARTHRTG